MVRWICAGGEAQGGICRDGGVRWQWRCSSSGDRARSARRMHQPRLLENTDADDTTAAMILKLQMRRKRGTGGSPVILLRKHGRPARATQNFTRSLNGRSNFSFTSIDEDRL